MSRGATRDRTVVAAGGNRAATVGAGVLSVAVLCTPSRARVAAAAVALALALTVGRSCALTAAVGVGEPAPLSGTLAARRGAAALHAIGHAAAARGRLVWIGDGRGGAGAEDAADRAAALSAEVGRAASAMAAPAAIALPLPRSDGLDRVLAWHHAIVVVLEPGTGEALGAHALASLAALGRPVAAMAPPGRLAVAAAVFGLAAPDAAAGAVTRLSLERRSAT